MNDSTNLICLGDGVSRVEVNTCICVYAVQLKREWLYETDTGGLEC